MHDVHLADNILKICRKKSANKLVKKVKIKLGSIIEHGEQIKPENLRFNLEMLSRNTNFAKAIFEIESVSGDTFEIEYLETVD